MKQQPPKKCIALQCKICVQFLLPTEQMKQQELWWVAVSENLYCCLVNHVCITTSGDMYADSCIPPANQIINDETTATRTNWTLDMVWTTTTTNRCAALWLFCVQLLGKSLVHHLLVDTCMLIIFLPFKNKWWNTSNNNWLTALLSENLYYLLIHWCINFWCMCADSIPANQIVNDETTATRTNCTLMWVNNSNNK